MLLLLKILLAHFLGDFVFQTKAWVDDKERNKIKAKGLYLHLGIHLILLLFAIGFQTKYIPLVLGIILTHYLIDLWKVYSDWPKYKMLQFAIDQGLHLLVIVLFVEQVDSYIHELPIEFSDLHLAALMLSLTLLTFAGATIIQILLSAWRPKTLEGGKDGSLQNAGTYIGMLERLFIFGFVITGNISAVGFLLAAKSVFRFGDLRKSKDRVLTEYILIGTLLSFGFALLVSYFYLWIKTI